MSIFIGSEATKPKFSIYWNTAIKSKKLFKIIRYLFLLTLSDRHTYWELSVWSYRVFSPIKKNSKVNSLKILDTE